MWQIRWAAEGRGAVTVTLIRDGALVRTVRARNISTIYPDQQPRLFVWLGSYVSTRGVPESTAMTQSLDQRGRTLEEALADRPRLGSTIHSFSSADGPDASVALAKVFPPLDADAVRAAVAR